MPSRSILDRLANGEHLLLDGGTGSEIQRRGADVLKGARAETGLEAWSATANIEFAEVVQQVHRDYLRVGADVILSNNFWTTKSRLEPIGLGDNWQEYARAAGENAIAARDRENPEAYVAGTFAPPSLQGKRNSGEPDVVLMGKEAFRAEVAEQVGILVDLGVDLLFPEYVSRIEDCVEIVDICAETRLPVFLGVRKIQPDGKMEHGESLADLGRALEGHKVDAVTLMCCRPEWINAGLPILRETYDGPFGAYPNIGYNPEAPINSSQGEDILLHDQYDRNNYTPSKLAGVAGEWKEMGAQVIGGCCSTGPEHIMAMRNTVKG